MGTKTKTQWKVLGLLGIHLQKLFAIMQLTIYNETRTIIYIKYEREINMILCITAAPCRV